MEEINVMELMLQISTQAEEKKRKEKLDFDDKWDITNETQTPSSHELLEELKEYMTLQYYRDLPGKGIKRQIKRVIRRMCGFFMLPIIEEQNRFNQKVYEVLKELVEAKK